MGDERTIHAKVLENLLVARHFPIHAKGVRMRGVRISGHLDLEAASAAAARYLWNTATSTPMSQSALTMPRRRISL